MRLNQTKSFDAFSEDRTGLKYKKLPFFKAYVLLEAISFSCMPIISFRFLWNRHNNDVVALGEREKIYDMLERAGLVLNETTIVPYVTFVLDHVYTEQGTLRLTERMGQVEFTTQPTTEERAYLEQTIRPAQVSDQGDHYSINATILYGKTLFLANLELTKEGLITFVSETVLREDLDCARPIFLE